MSLPLFPFLSLKWGGGIYLTVDSLEGLVPSHLLPFCLLPFCLLPFRLLKTKLCHFAYSPKNGYFFDAETSIQATQLAFSTTEVKEWFFHFASSPGYPYLGFFIHFTHQTIGTSYTSFCVSLICTTSLEAAKVTVPNLPKVDEFCNIL